MSRVRTVAALLVAALAAASGCERRESGPAGSGSTGGKQVQLILYCGAGIRPAAEALIAAFEKETGIRVSPNYGGSGVLLGQLTAARRGDLFMPGAELYVDIAVENGLADPATRRVVGYFVPVIFVQKGNPKGVGSVAHLARDDVRLGLGDERACAVGKKAVAIFEKSGVALADFEDNTVYKSGTVNELGLAIQLGNVDAVIIWDANARQFAAHGETVLIPPEQNAISAFPIAALTFSEHPGEAMRFIEFVTSGKGRRIVRECGYTVELPSSPPEPDGGAR